VLEGRHDSASLSAGLTGAPVEMVGALRWPEPRGLFTPADDAAHGTFFVRDIQAMAAARGWGPVPEVYIDLEAPAPAAGPRPGPLAVALPNRHLEYAVTWFGLAAVLVLVLIFRVAGGRGQRNAAPP